MIKINKSFYYKTTIEIAIWYYINIVSSTKFRYLNLLSTFDIIDKLVKNVFIHASLF